MNLNKLWCCLLLPTTLFAQESLPIYLSFDFVELAAAKHFGDQRAEAEIEIAARLAQACGQKVGFWKFMQGSGYPNLAVRLAADSGLWQLKAELKMDGETISGEWDCDIFQPGEVDIHGMPGNKQWPAKIETQFRNGILKDNGAALMDQLVKLPLGKQVGTVTQDAVTYFNAGVLPLDFETYKNCISSLFQIVYKRDDGNPITPPEAIYVHSRAACVPFSFPGLPDLKGILVHHEKWRKHGGEAQLVTGDLGGVLNGFEPGRFYLLESNRDTWRQWCEDLEIAGGSHE